MHPSTRNRIGAIAPLACALLCLTSCNRATHPTYPEGSGSTGPIGSGGVDNPPSNGGITRALVGSWRQTDSKGNEYGYGDTTTFDVRGGFTYVRRPPALKTQTHREEKGTYYTSGDSLFISRTSIRESIDGKEWVEYSPRKSTYTFVVAGDELTINDIFDEDYYFVR